jgi:hypothetical protein
MSIAAPAEQHERILAETLGPLVRGWRDDSRLESLFFERVNKPAWGLLVTARGVGSWLTEEVRAAIEATLGTAAVAVASEVEAEDKWVGGVRDSAGLRQIHFADTLAFFDRLELESSGVLSRQRAEYSLRAVERLLDAFGFRDEERLDFYRRGYAWAVDLGRWDSDVFGQLDRKYRAQREALCAILGAGDDTTWEAPAEGRVAGAFLRCARAAIEVLRADADADEPPRDFVEIATFAAHAHSNRLGIFATQEAMMRYLVWRARSDGVPAAAG